MTTTTTTRDRWILYGNHKVDCRFIPISSYHTVFAFSKMIFRTTAVFALFTASASAFAHTSGSHMGSRTSTSLDMSAALIVQNKGGGHGELGYQLAKNLMNNDKITSITILQDDACKDEQEPFRSYASDLPDVKVIKAPISDGISAEEMQKLLEGATFEYVWDNASKNNEGSGKAVLDCAQSWNVKLLTYVSSAGMYTPAANGPFPMPETTPIKESAGQNLYDQAAVAAGLPLVSFRPQYIYGPKANKYDYLDWYFDRIVRGLPLPIPGDGTQMVSITNSEDVASILASPLNNEEAAVEQRFFNCGSDQLISYADLATRCAEAAGVECPELVYYDANLLGKGKFPFRPSNFYVAPDKVKEKLGWTGASHAIVEDLGPYFENYKARGGMDKQLSLVKDWEIVCGHMTPMYEKVSSIYEKYDPLVLN